MIILISVGIDSGVGKLDDGGAAMLFLLCTALDDDKAMLWLLFIEPSTATTISRLLAKYNYTGTR